MHYSGYTCISLRMQYSDVLQNFPCSLWQLLTSAKWIVQTVAMELRMGCVECNPSCSLYSSYKNKSNTVARLIIPTMEIRKQELSRVYSHMHTCTHLGSCSVVYTARVRKSCMAAPFTAWTEVLLTLIALGSCS